MVPTLPTSIVQLHLAEAEAWGLDRETLLARAGLDPSALVDPNARVPIANQFRLWLALGTRVPSPEFGFGVASRLGPGDFGVVDYVMRNCPTFGESLEARARYQRLLFDQEHELERVSYTDDEVVMGYYVPPPVVGLRHPADWVVAATCELSRQLSGGRAQPLWIGFPHLEDGREAKLRERVGPGVELRFGLEHAAVSYPRSVLALTNVDADPRLATYVQADADCRLAAMPPTSHGDQVREAISGALIRGQRPKQAAVARTMGLSQRTLQRRLDELGMSFAKLVDEQRHQLALKWLDQARMNNSEIAFMLGYTNDTSFYRAFRRWTGQTPNSWKHRVHES